jgi:hypothetical protein
VITNPRAETALEFMLDNGVKAEKALEYLKGIDLTKPVVATVLKKGTVVIQYVAKNGRIGNWIAPPGTPLAKLGIAANGRVLRVFETTLPETQVLKSTAADAVDTWTVRGQAIPAEGGGTQYFIPDQSTLTPVTQPFEAWGPGTGSLP